MKIKSKDSRFLSITFTEGFIQTINSIKYYSTSNSSNYLGSYFAGVIEGDGSIVVPTS
jgi:hypothetical protein